MKTHKRKWLLVALLLVSILLLWQELKREVPAEATYIPPTPQEFLKQEITEQGLTNRDFLILKEIIQCESGWAQFWERDYNGHVKGEVKVSEGNIGLGQINYLAHHEEYEKLGLDMNDPFDNLTYSVILYKRNGVRDWSNWSGHCFLPKIKNFK